MTQSNIGMTVGSAVRGSLSLLAKELRTKAKPEAPVSIRACIGQLSIAAVIFMWLSVANDCSNFNLLHSIGRLSNGVNLLTSAGPLPPQKAGQVTVFEIFYQADRI